MQPLHLDIISRYNKKSIGETLYIINAIHRISSSRRKYSLRLMIYAYGDDIHADA